MEPTPPRPPSNDRPSDLDAPRQDPGDMVDPDVRAVHHGGKLAVASRFPLTDGAALARLYTPGVAQVSRAIRADTDLAREYTGKGNAVAVVTDGSAVLGLGDIGATAALPVMEGKAVLFKELAGVDAYPLCLDERDPDRLVELVAAVAPGFGGINLEDISAPRCFEVEGKLKRRLPVPVFHDDQHGTAIVVLAALENACRVVGKELTGLRVVVQGLGAAGIAISTLLLAAGVDDLVGVDVHGIVTTRRADARDPILRRLAKNSNPRNVTGGLGDALDGADAFIGVSAGGTVTGADLDRMRPDRIVFALANPNPEVDPAVARARAAVVATGRSDEPNQINNVLCFPGLFRGLLDARARHVDEEGKLAAARAIADVVGTPTPDRIVPEPLDPAVVPAVAHAVAAATGADGTA